MTWRKGAVGVALIGTLGACSAILGIGDLPSDLTSDGEGGAGSDGSSSSDAPVTLADGALAPAPKPLSPLSASRATSRTPTFSWALLDGSTSAYLDLCYDRACKRPIITAPLVSGSSYMPKDALPGGTIFWRTRSSITPSSASATWEVVIPQHASGTVDSSWGTIFDANGDSYTDLVVTAPHANSQTGAAYVFQGAETGLMASSPAQTIIGPGGLSGDFGQTLSGAGDMNGDGFADLVMAGTGGHVYVYRGASGGIETTPWSTLFSTDSPNGLGTDVVNVGDVNRDGYGDIAVGYVDTSGNESVYIFDGDPTLLSATPAQILASPELANASFGGRLASGDVNGDGRTDLIVTAFDANANDGVAYLYLATASGFQSTPDATKLDPPGDLGGYFGGSAACADVNGDGYADVLIGATHDASQAGRVYVYLGSSGGLVLPYATTLTGGPSAGLGNYLARGDINQDGRDDVAVGAFRENGVGNVHVYLGGDAGIPEWDDGGSNVTWVAQTVGGMPSFGESITFADVENDSDPQLFVGEPQTSGTTPGSTYQVKASPFVSLDNPNDGGSWFGYRIFGSN